MNQINAKGGATFTKGKHRAEIHVELRHKPGKGLQLSMSGELWEGPKTRDERNLISAGQSQDSIREIFGSDLEAARMLDVWDRWHLNDMRAGCEHQRAEGWGLDRVEVVTYKINSDAWKIKREAEAEAMNAARDGRAANLSEVAKFLIGPDWYKERFMPPDADDIFSGLYEVGKRETQYSGHTYEHQHPRGVLCKPCPVCGYKYGSAWLFEPLPAEIVEEVRKWCPADMRDIPENETPDQMAKRRGYDIHGKAVK